MTFAKKLLAAAQKWQTGGKGIELRADDVSHLTVVAEEDSADEYQSFGFLFDVGPGQTLHLNIQNPRLWKHTRPSSLTADVAGLSCTIMREVLAFEGEMVKALIS